jgi:DNA uptake protein ComE-like DNA-binding protein
MKDIDRAKIGSRKLTSAILLLCSMSLFLGACSNNSVPDASVPTTSNTAAKSGQIDINSAPIAELDKLELPGTKPSLSERIQGGRPYKTIEDLVIKKVISAEEFKLIKGLTVAGQSK